MAAVLKHIRSARGLSEAEKFQWARSLAATPDQRWQRNETVLHSLGSFMRSAKKRFPS